MQNRGPGGPPGDPLGPSDNGSRKCKSPYWNSVPSKVSDSKIYYMEALDEGSLSLKYQTLRTPTSGFKASENKPLLSTGSYFLTPGDPRNRKFGGLVGTGKTSMAFEFGPNPMVRPEVISTGEISNLRKVKSEGIFTL